MLKVVFRADAASHIGSGHIMRCLTLAIELKTRGVNCRFICRQLGGNLVDYISENGFETIVLPAESIQYKESLGNEPDSAVHANWLSVDWDVDANETVNALAGSKVDCLIVDHYALDERWESAVRVACRRIVAVDDLADRRHECDILVDPGIEPDLEAKYRDLTPTNCLRLVGPQYAMLRPEFDDAKLNLARRAENIRPGKIVVGFGGSDRDLSTLMCLEVIERIAPADTKIDVIISITNESKAQIIQFCEYRSRFKCHIATNNLASIFANADLAIGSGGGVTYERLYLRLPSIVKIVAENQRAPLEYMHSMGLIEIYDDPSELSQLLLKAFAGGAKLPIDIVRNGVPEICDAIVRSDIQLLKPSPYDVRRSFVWLSDDGLREKFLMNDKPQRLQHFRYWRALLESESERVYSVIENQEHIGNAGIKNIDVTVGEAELWLYIGRSENRGRGLGASILRSLEQIIVSELGCKKAVLHVSRVNMAASRLYSGSGYKSACEKIGSTALFAPSANVARMEKML